MHRHSSPPGTPGSSSWTAVKTGNQPRTAVLLTHRVAVDSFEEQRFHEVPVRFFRELVRRTVFATDTESSRYALGGVLLEMHAEGIIAVATDGDWPVSTELPVLDINDPAQIAEFLCSRFCDLKDPPSG